MIGTFRGVKIIISDAAVKPTTVRLFPSSKHRSERIRKKLIKRHGGEFRNEPCIYKTSQGFIAHPTLYAQLKQLELEQRA